MQSSSTETGGIGCSSDGARQRGRGSSAKGPSGSAVGRGPRRLVLPAMAVGVWGLQPSRLQRSIHSGPQPVRVAESVPTHRRWPRVPPLPSRRRSLTDPFRVSSNARSSRRVGSPVRRRDRALPAGRPGGVQARCGHIIQRWLRSGRHRGGWTAGFRRGDIRLRGRTPAPSVEARTRSSTFCGATTGVAYLALVRVGISSPISNVLGQPFLRFFSTGMGTGARTVIPRARADSGARWDYRPAAERP